MILRPIINFPRPNLYSGLDLQLTNRVEGIVIERWFSWSNDSPTLLAPFSCFCIPFAFC